MKWYYNIYEGCFDCGEGGWGAFHPGSLKNKQIFQIVYNEMWCILEVRSQSVCGWKPPRLETLGIDTDTDQSGSN